MIVHIFVDKKGSGFWTVLDFLLCFFCNEHQYSKDRLIKKIKNNYNEQYDYSDDTAAFA